MKMLITHHVASCRDCHHSTNSSQLHDCAFTSAPLPIRWYCSHGGELRGVNNEDVIDAQCPVAAQGDTP